MINDLNERDQAAIAAMVAELPNPAAVEDFYAHLCLDHLRLRWVCEQGVSSDQSMRDAVYAHAMRISKHRDHAAPTDDDWFDGFRLAVDEARGRQP
jgi:hypothetical protein